MELKITGVARIAEADLKLNGITVVVGDNNTGKTTVGKALYAFFNSFSGLEGRMSAMRLKKCYETLGGAWPWLEEDVFRAFLKKEGDSDENLASHVMDAMVADAESDSDADKRAAAALDGIMKQLRAIRDLDDHEICEQIVTNNFRQVFADEYMPAKARGKAGSQVRLTLKGRPYVLNLEKGGIHYESGPSLEHAAYFIDTPDLMEDLSRHTKCNALGLGLTHEIVRNMQPKADPGESAIDDVLANQKLKRILDRIDSVIHGQVASASNGRIAYADGEMGASFRLANMSRGVRAFALLQTAIRYRALKDRDVLILDEPEIHLHPEWLMEYAELLVVMQEEMDLTVLVTTHSAYFLQALQLYAKKHRRLNRLNAYKAVKADDGNVEIREELPGENWDKAYLSFLLAANRLRQLRDEVDGIEE